MNKKRKERWKKKRAKGKSEFILRDGGVIFGLIFMGIIAPIIKFIVSFIENNFTLSFFDKNFQVSIIFGLILAFPLGCLFGWLVWEISEWSYLRDKSVLK